MDDERTLRETDVRVRAALMPDEAAARQVVDRALAGDRPPRQRARQLPRFTWALTALALIIVSISAWQWRRAAAATSPASLAVTGRGSIVVVEHQDGRRWVVGPPPERRAGGNYVIVVQK